MNTYKKLLIAYYAKQITASIGFALLYSLSLISGKTEGIEKINEYYKKVAESIIYPVKVDFATNAHNKVKVA